ncbi:MAG: hypothetical protein HY663_00380 [Chloroflexi bacterium]|nr:hypothetical protein [Chloroflexota bacterium]
MSSLKTDKDKMNKSEIVTRCIDEILDGQSSLEDCLRRYPELADELRFSLAIATRMHEQRAVISPEFKRAARARLFLEDETQPLPKAHGSILDWLRPVTLLRVPLAILVVVVALVGGGTTVVYASQNSLPGDVLYPMKIGSENVQLALTLDPESKARMSLKLAERRVEEVVAQSAQGRDVSAAAPEAISRHLDAAIKEIENLDEDKSRSLISQLSQSTINQQVALSQLLTESSDLKQLLLQESIDTSRRGNTVAVVAEANPAFLTSSPSTADKNLEETYFKVEGILRSVGRDWNIGGITIRNLSVPHGMPFSVNSRVAVEGITRHGKTFIAKVKEKEDQKGDEVRIEGIFNGTGENGAIWHISGIAIGKPQNASLVAEGTPLKLTGLVQNGIFVVSRLESEDDKKEVKITGTLVEVDQDITTVSLEIARAKIVVRLRDAEVETDSGKSFETSVLRALMGKDVTLSALKINDGVLSTEKLYVSDENMPKTTKDKSDDKTSENKKDSQKSDKDEPGNKTNDGKEVSQKSDEDESSNKTRDEKEDSQKSDNDGVLSTEKASGGDENLPNITKDESENDEVDNDEDESDDKTNDGKEDNQKSDKHKESD